MAIDFMSAGGAVLDTTTAGAGDIKSGKTAYNGDGELVTGTYALPSTTAGAGDILKDKTAVDSSGTLLTGTMVNNGRWPDAEKLTLEGSKIWMYKKSGYTEGGLGISASNLGNASSGHVLSGVSASSSNGLKFGGTMTNRGAWSNSVNPGGSVTIPAGYHNGSGKVTGNRSYTTVYLGQQSGYWSSFTYNVKSNYPSIYSRLSRSNFYAVPYKYSANTGPNGGYSNSGNCSDFISYNSSTGVVTMNGFGAGVQGQIRMAFMFKLYMVY